MDTWHCHHSALPVQITRPASRTVLTSAVSIKTRVVDWLSEGWAVWKLRWIGGISFEEDFASPGKNLKENRTDAMSFQHGWFHLHPTPPGDTCPGWLHTPIKNSFVRFCCDIWLSPSHSVWGFVTFHRHHPILCRGICATPHHQHLLSTPVSLNCQGATQEWWNLLYRVIFLSFMSIFYINFDKLYVAEKNNWVKIHHPEDQVSSWGSSWVCKDIKPYGHTGVPSPIWANCPHGSLLPLLALGRYTVFAF